MWVTILTPLFNGIEYFEECYNAIVNQTEKEWVWIIGINGHNDTVIYDNLKKLTDPRILVKQYTTKGKVATLNEMMKEVSSTYVALCDCDDIWFPEKLEIQKQFVEKYNFDVFSCGCVYIGEHSGSPNLPHGSISVSTLFTINPIINSCVLMKSTCAIWEDRFGLEDYDLWFRLALENKTIVTIVQPFIYHRIHSSSAFNNSGVQDVNGLLSYYKKKIRDVTVVSAYYPLKSKYDPKEYLKWMELWSTLDCNLVFFTTPELVTYFENLRGLKPTKIITLDFSELEAYKRYGNDLWKLQNEKDHEEAHTPELYVIWYEKKEFVKKAIDLDYFNTNKFVWCDAGICRSKQWIPFIRNFPRSDKITNKFTVLRITDFENHEDYQKINCVGGGILAGTKENWLIYYDKYDSMLKKYINNDKFIGKDQSIIASLIKEEPEFFNVVPYITELDGFTCWFSLLFLLS